MKEEKNNNIFINLAKSYQIESSLIQNYKYFSNVADYEGLGETSQLLKNISETSLDNAQGSLDYLMEYSDPDTEMPLGNTILHLESLIASETKQFTEIYPYFIKQSRLDGAEDIASWYETLEKLKRKHVEILKNELDRIKKLNIN